ncbi:MAG: PSD1 and planctomycete cytochrome C domain-containing protein [Planctomycetota bacterium]|nr:PSD1 and planctomycete cytochrome C domain-containing protein [Planctomycetota bacterium]
MSPLHYLLPPPLLIAVASSVLGAQVQSSTAQDREHFEARIRPVLIEHCYTCHNSVDKARGGLALDGREPMRMESDSGFAVVPGDPDQSLILAVMRHEIDGLEMPRDGGKLDASVVADFEEWIRNGAYDPRDAAPTNQELEALISWAAKFELRKQWWSLQPIVVPVLPEAGDWSEHPVDRFIQQGMVENGLLPSPEADRRTLVRRLYYTLLGLPPTPDEIRHFLADEDPDALARLIDQLLASPRYGERWARHWMDLVRYADSHGSEGDPRIPHAYQYRDYLIRAFNQDLPFDQFVREQIAGDLLSEPRLNSELGINESAIGTAQWRFVFHGFAPTDALDEKVRFTDDQINVFSKTFLAQTVSCARCHDHKFDAISQADYYALFGILGSSRPAMLDVNTAEIQQRNKSDLVELKAEIRTALAEAWSTWKLSPDELPEQAKSLDHPLHLLWDIDQRMGAGLGFEAAWEAASAGAQNTEPSLDYERRWNLASTTEMDEWYPSGNGLAGGISSAGEFAVAPAGEQVLSGIYPAGVYTHLLSSRHRGVLQSAHFSLEGEYELWFRVLGGGGAKLRYAVHNYPRSGTVFPITEIKSDTWSWLRLDLSYWDGDSVHLELYTGQDAPIEVGGSDRSWFGVREVRLRKKGAGRPADPMVSGQVFEEVPQSRVELAGRIAQRIDEAIESWKRSAATDSQALLLDACLREGLLANDLAQLPQVAKLVGAYRELDAAVPLPTRVPGIVEADASDQALYVRGDHRNPGAIIPRRFLEAIDPEPYAPGTGGRLELAEDLLRADNPLTSRVITNRIWHHLFGQGLVTTPDNFGRLGTKPSHPELLDYLSGRMVEKSWSIKEMIRFLLLSKTWRMSSAASPIALALDPGNKWLSHANVRRLDAEAIRDSLFSAAGRLDQRMFGPGFGPNSSTPRRSVYVESRRNALDAFLQSFDAPVPFDTLGSRHVTNVPAQALTMLNDPMVGDLAKSWGARMRSSGKGKHEGESFALMFEAVTGREPGADELAALCAYADECRSAFRIDRERRRELEAGLASNLAALDSMWVWWQRGWKGRTEVLAALGPEDRAAVLEIEVAIAGARRGIEKLGPPVREDESWARVAHALYNLKEFLYLR